jgi:hypothetical protein
LQMASSPHARTGRERKSGKPVFYCKFAKNSESCNFKGKFTNGARNRTPVFAVGWGDFESVPATRLPTLSGTAKERRASWFETPARVGLLTMRPLCYRPPIFSHSHRATASGELAPSPPAARKLASRMVAMSIFPSNGPSAARKP